MSALRRVVRNLFVERGKAQVAHEFVAEFLDRVARGGCSFRKHPGVYAMERSALPVLRPADVVRALAVDRFKEWPFRVVAILTAGLPDVSEQVQAESLPRTKVWLAVWTVISRGGVDVDVIARREEAANSATQPGQKTATLSVPSFSNPRYASQPQARSSDLWDTRASDP